MNFTRYIFIFTTSVLFWTTSIAEIRQVWALQISVGEDGGPCEAAAVSLSVRDSKGVVLHTTAPSLAPDVLGISILEMSIVIPGPGSYVLRADFTLCDGAKFSADPISIPVSGAGETRTIHIYGSGTPDSWRFDYFGVTSETSGGDIFSVEPTSPPTIRNLLDVPLRPCAMSLWPQVEVLEFVGAEWRQKGTYEFPESSKSVAPGSTLKLQRSGLIVKRFSPEPEPEPTAYAIVLRVLPPLTTYQYLSPVPDRGLEEPFPGTCDVYYIPYEPPQGSKGEGLDG